MQSQIERDSKHNDMEWKYIRSLEEALRDALCRLNDADMPKDQHTQDIINKGFDLLEPKPA